MSKQIIQNEFGPNIQDISQPLRISICSQNQNNKLM